MTSIESKKKAKPKMVELEWWTNTRGLIEEIAMNPGMGILARPLEIFYGQLQKVAARAIELNDPQLNVLMLQLSLYSVADPQSPDFDLDRTMKLIEQFQKESDLD